jgi:hypothetical protein
MKLNTRTIGFGLIVIFVVALVILYLGYQKQVNAKKLADQNLAGAQALLTKATTDKTNASKELNQANDQLNQLQGELSQIKQNLAVIQSSLPVSLDGINYTDIVYETANNANVRIQFPLQSLTQSELASKTINGIGFATQSFSFSVKADNFTDIISFIHALATKEPFKNAGIETINISTVHC